MKINIQFESVSQPEVTAIAATAAYLTGNKEITFNDLYIALIFILETLREEDLPNGTADITDSIIGLGVECHNMVSFLANDKRIDALAEELKEFYKDEL